MEQNRDDEEETKEERPNFIFITRQSWKHVYMDSSYK